MKTNKIIILLIAFVTSISFTSCVEDGDFTVPQSLGLEENKSLTNILEAIDAKTVELKTIKQVKDLFVANTVTEIIGDFVVKGYVTSSDHTGNFYKEFFIQDNAENPTTAIKVVLELTNSNNKFNFGREVYINLKGLFIGETRSGDGVIAIGGAANADDEVENLSLSQIEKNILRSATTATIVPLPVKLSQINNGHVGLFVQVNDAHFPTNLAGKPFVDPNDQFDTQRTLEACEGFGFATFILETSSFASFKSSGIPSGGGTIAAVVSKTFNGSDLVLALNDVNDVNMEGARCTPLDIKDFTVVLNEDFNSGTDNSDLNFPNWTNFAETGGELWTEQVFSGNGYAEFSGFRTNDAVNVGWLVSPGIDMSANSQVFINFQLAQHHLESDENTLEVFVSTNFDGTNVTAATWEKVDASIPTQSDSWYAFKDAGLIDVSSYSGTLYVAFKYVGSGTDTALDGAYMVDDFKVLAK
ncbi:DUF5689 domain-containing protein [uncultured Polaribacter sp.]|uniref:DUF5689 domain-containing protein n=1 Tax=uncultured Polaribacter sp. TaxID=174711 RepID=UPI0026041960|nr:DUF5689 domain-containing protein [uncultured Polaribacter sp.]